jgi:hypothetical protein
MPPISSVSFISGLLEPVADGPFPLGAYFYYLLAR